MRKSWLIAHVAYKAGLGCLHCAHNYIAFSVSLCLSGSILLAVGAAVSIDPDQRPTTRTPNCTEGGCHASITQFRYLHAPAAVGACDACHTYDDVTKHTFTFKHSEPQMCSFCHIGKSTPGQWPGAAPMPPGLHVHEPVAEGQCIACHNPHGSHGRNLITADTLTAMCITCHESAAASSHKNAHQPLADGDCMSCHLAHSSFHAGLLIKPQRDLCISCHENAVPRMALGSRLPAVGFLQALTRHLPTSHIHDPLLGECSECHEHHGSSHDALLRSDPASLCMSCHEDVANAIASAPFSHSAVKNDRACLNCHTPHHSMHTHLMRDSQMTVCLECHATPTERNGRTINSMAMLHEPGKMLHGALTEDGCGGCHTVHGGTRQSLLTHNYSTDLYQPFSTASYALCFSCHDSALATQQHTTTATKFRDGDLNLHYIHVTAEDESGRSCRLCHNDHASRQPMLMHESVPYGQWQLPITFTPTETGGSCGAGCHREREYRRD
jgi:predicted CXXCH cytochrome family protein